MHQKTGITTLKSITFDWFSGLFCNVTRISGS